MKLLAPEKFSLSGVLFSFIIILFALFSCNQDRQKSFSQDDWTLREDGFYLNRQYVVNDLLNNHLKEGMTYTEIISLLGKPDYQSLETDSMIHYEILEKYSLNIDPDEIRYLDIKLGKDSLLIRAEVRITK